MATVFHHKTIALSAALLSATVTSVPAIADVMALQDAREFASVVQQEKGLVGVFVSAPVMFTTREGYGQKAGERRSVVYALVIRKSSESKMGDGSCERQGLNYPNNIELQIRDAKTMKVLSSESGFFIDPNELTGKGELNLYGSSSGCYTMDSAWLIVGKDLTTLKINAKFGWDNFNFGRPDNSLDESVTFIRRK